MIKGDKIVDLRDNSIHIVDTIDEYESVNLVFTDDKKYIPTHELIRYYDIEDIVPKGRLNDMDEIWDSITKNVVKNCIKSFDLDKNKKSPFRFFKKLFNLKNIFK